MDEDGYFFVTDHGNFRIAVFDPDGDFSHGFGGQGAGPGEFQSIKFQTIDNGIISIYDWSLRRTSRYSKDGSFLDVTSAPPQGFDTILGLNILPDGRQVLLVRNIPYEGGNREDEWNRFLILDEDQNTLWSHTFEKVKTRYTGVLKTSGGEYSESFWYQYGSKPAIRFKPDIGIVSSTGITPNLNIYDTEGNHLKRIEVNIEPEQITRQEKRFIRGFLEERARRNPGYMGDMFTSELEVMEWLPHKAYWNEIEVDDFGFFWLQHPTHSMVQRSTVAEGFRFRVLSPEGEYLGNTQWPQGFTGRVCHGHLCMMHHNLDTGEYALKVYRIIPTVEGLMYPN